MIAELLPRDEARRIYDSIVNQLRDPALLEFAGLGAVKSSVFPVPPHQPVRLRLVYQELLGRDGERVDYVLPRSDNKGTDKTFSFARFPCSVFRQQEAGSR